MNAPVKSNIAYYEVTDDSLLAKASALVRRKDRPDDIAWQEFRVTLERRLYSLRAWRLTWWRHWGTIAEALLPRRYQYLIAPNTMTRGNAINQSIVDPTATIAMRIATAGMRSGLVSSSRQFFKIKHGMKGITPDREAQQWFETVEDNMYRVLSGSNFYQMWTQAFEDLIAFGTAPLITYEDKKSVIRLYSPVCGEYFLGAGSDFRVNSFYRTFVLTVLQVVQMFGPENVGPEVQGLWETKGASLDLEIIVAHAIEPNFDASSPGGLKRQGVVEGGFEYREVYWLWGKPTPKPLSVVGRRTKPFIAPRWATTSNDAYGRSPGMDALPDILQLHQMTRRQAEAIEKLVRPPLMADVSMESRPTALTPGKVTYVTNMAEGGIKPVYTVNPDVDKISALIEKIEKRVERWFFVDLFMMLDQKEGVQPMNQMELSERRNEKLQVLGPIVEGVEQEVADQLRQIYEIMNRRGLIPPKPRSLEGAPIEIEILSMIAMAQRAADTSTMERTVQIGAQMQALYPDAPPLDNVDPDKFFREYAEKVNFPASVMRGEDQVAAIRKARAQAQQAAMKQQQDAQTATHTLPAVASAAKDISDTDVGGALNALGISGAQ
jgi:hypothetical protein